MDFYVHILKIALPEKGRIFKKGNANLYILKIAVLEKGRIFKKGNANLYKNILNYLKIKNKWDL